VSDLHYPNIWCSLWGKPAIGKSEAIEMQPNIVLHDFPRSTQSRAERSPLAKCLNSRLPHNLSVPRCCSNMPSQAARAGHGSGMIECCDFQLIASSYTQCPPRTTPTTPPQPHFLSPGCPINVWRTRHRPEWSQHSKKWSARGVVWRGLDLSCSPSMIRLPSFCKMLRLGVVKQPPRYSGAFTAVLRHVRHLRLAPSRSPRATSTRVAGGGGLLWPAKCCRMPSRPPASSQNRRRGQRHIVPGRGQMGT